ncbi:Tho complex subunit 7-domain-containing protein [Bombardia bombarda]|uniref:Tho complex subunit 7-domain-containing protein n=1 Tax=Bombardia bombarda TaxID=252184 RepID=A0AA39WMB3_9PEZI|nr:Tho complex subunit 7-domain-containing protein [Bombardia bombarda]
MASWGLLDDKEENELHKSRLLNVEEKPFKRVTKRLSTLHSLAVTRARQAPTPPPENNVNSAAADDTSSSSPAAALGGTGSYQSDLAQLKEDITLDFAAFDSSIARLQFLLTANERERERYAAERERIISTAQAVRENTSQLRQQLDQARATLEQRRKFDELADKITSNPSLRPRAEQAANLRKLEDEISELEAESKTYGVTWHERRDQFSKIMDESMRLRRLIRDEKEEVERREGMDGEGGLSADLADGGAGGQTPRPSGGIASGSGTPRAESGLVLHGGHGSAGAGTPRPLSTAGGRTPARESPAPSAQDSGSFLKPHHHLEDGGGSFSVSGSQAQSREGSMDRGEREEERGEDVDMREEVEEEEEEEEPDSPLTPLPADTPQIVVDGEDRMDIT